MANLRNLGEASRLINLAPGTISAGAAGGTANGAPLSDFEYVTVVPTTHKTTTGFLSGTDGHGARIELGIRVRARKSF